MGQGVQLLALAEITAVCISLFFEIAAEALDPFGRDVGKRDLLSPLVSLEVFQTAFPIPSITEALNPAPLFDEGIVIVKEQHLRAVLFFEAILAVAQLDYALGADGLGHS